MHRPRALLSLVVSLAFSACGGEPKPAASPLPPAEEPASKSLSPEECQAQSGEVLYDKGDGKLQAEGCPDGRAQLGMVSGGEGALCCSLSGAAPSEPPTG